MTSYNCETCLKSFVRKSGYDAHMSKKKPCVPSKTTQQLIDEKAAKLSKELLEDGISKLPDTEDGRKAYFQKFFEDLHNLLLNRAGLNPDKSLDHMNFFFAYRLLDEHADELKLPNVCRWSYIAALRDEHDMLDKIRKGYETFKKNPITSAFFKQPEISKAAVVCDIVKLINKLPLSAIRESDTLGAIYEYMIGRGMSTMSDEGQYFTNRKICELAFELTHSIKNTIWRSDGSLCTFGDFFCGTGGFPSEFVKGVAHKASENGQIIDWNVASNNIYCQDMSVSSVNTTSLNMLILTGTLFNSRNIRSGNSFSDPITIGESAPFKDVTLDYCFMNPPYGGDKTKGKEYKFVYTKGKGSAKTYLVNKEIQSIGIEDDDKVSAGVQLAMATLSSDGGICAIVLPQGFFFGASKKCVELRKKIAEEYKIYYVVDIASGSFLNTGTKTSMIVFQKGAGSTENVKFIGLDEKLLVEATLVDLRSKSYSLNYKQYLPQSAVEVEGFEMVKLKDIVSFKAEKSKKDKSSYTYIDIGSVDRGKFKKGDTITKDDLPGRAQYSVKVGDILLGTVRPNLEHYLSISPQIYRDDLIVSNGFSIMRCDTNKVLPTYLYSILTLSSTTEYLTERATGTTYPVVDDAIIGEMEILLPSLERQEEIVQAIDIWTNLAQQEESTLKMLEQQMMFEVKEMGRGKPRVKLGDVCEINHGKRITKKNNIGTKYPVYGGGDDTFKTDNKNREDITCKISRFGISEFNCVQMIYGDYWLMDSGFTVNGIKGKTTDYYISYWLLNNKSTIYGCGRATAQMNMDMDTFRQVEIPLPSLGEQKELQPHFDEIRHKHAKIAEYKAKAQEAIKKFIPK